MGDVNHRPEMKSSESVWIGRVDEELAYARFKNLAYKRYPIAMYNYGWMILVGHGTKANSRRGHMWIDRAADAGCTIWQDAIMPGKECLGMKKRTGNWCRWQLTDHLTIFEADP